MAPRTHAPDVDCASCAASRPARPRLALHSSVACAQPSPLEPTEPCAPAARRSGRDALRRRWPADARSSMRSLGLEPHGDPRHADRVRRGGGASVAGAHRRLRRAPRVRGHGAHRADDQRRRTSPGSPIASAIPFGAGRAAAGALVRRFARSWLGAARSPASACSSASPSSICARATTRRRPPGLHARRSPSTCPSSAAPSAGGIALRLYGRMMITPTRRPRRQHRASSSRPSSGQLFAGLAYYP